MQYKHIAVGSLIILMFSSGISQAEAQTPDKIMQDPLIQRFLQEATEKIRQERQKPFAQEGSLFHVHYKNETAKPIDAGALLEQSTILLDGKLYPYHGPDPFYFFIQAHQDDMFFISPDDYVPKVKRSVLADCLHRWHWVTAIPQGMHTMSFQFGGRQYGPVYFYWSGPGSWNIPYPETSTPQN